MMMISLEALVKKIDYLINDENTAIERCILYQNEIKYHFDFSSISIHIIYFFYINCI